MEVQGRVRCIIFERCYPGEHPSTEGGSYPGGIGENKRWPTHSTREEPNSMKRINYPRRAFLCMIFLTLIMQAVLREAKTRQLKLVGNTPPRRGNALENW